MKTILTMITGCLILTGCYTQFNAGSSSSGTRTPDYSKVETQVDENTRVTDYYDNSSYSWYLRNFSYGFGYRYYDMYGYDPVLNHLGTYNTWGWGYGNYYGMGYDYIDYRISLWHRYHPYWGDWYYNSPAVVYYYPSDGNTGQTTSKRGRRETRENVLVGGNSTQYNMPVNVSNIGTPSSSYKIPAQTEGTRSRGVREEVLGGPAINQSGSGSSSATVSKPATSSTSTSSSGSTTRTGREDVFGGPAKSTSSAAQPPPQQTAPPETRQASPPPPAPSNPAPTHRRTSRGRDN